MSELPSLTYREKVLLYLKDYIDLFPEEPLPVDITQKGISEGVDMSRTHVSRVVQGLIEEGFVKEKRTSIKGKNRKLKTYFLTQEGLEKSKALYRELGELSAHIIKDGVEKEILLSEIENETGGKIGLLDIFTDTDIDRKDDIIDIDDIQPITPVIHLDSKPSVSTLHGREDPIQKLKDWLNGEEPFAVLRGRKGIGTTSVVSKFIDEIEERHILWLNITKKNYKKMKKEIISFLSDLEERSIKEDVDEKDIVNRMNREKILVVFDDYYRVDDHVVDFLSLIVGEYKETSKAKYIVTARGGIPVYERFYHLDDVEEGKVEEFELGAVGKEDALKILGADIEKGALKRIMQLTNGSPFILKLLAEEKKEKIIEISPLSRSQVSLLMFLKDQRR
ncbi:MAG: NB-ARC domain-containing protein [Thermoplasmatota archaeon]